MAKKIFPRTYAATPNICHASSLGKTNFATSRVTVSAALKYKNFIIQETIGFLLSKKYLKMGYAPPRNKYSKPTILSGNSTNDSALVTAHISQGHIPPNSITAKAIQTAPKTTAHKSKTPVIVPRYKQTKLSPARIAQTVSFIVFLNVFFIYQRQRMQSPPIHSQQQSIHQSV